MNMEKIEAEIRMFDRIELIFAIGAAAAAAVLLIMIAARMKRNDLKPGKGALIISMAVLVVTGIYTGTVVFADEESLSAESEGPHMDLIENAEVPWDAAIKITGIASEGCYLKMTVTDEKEAAGAEETNPEETSAEETNPKETSAEETTPEEMPAEETFDPNVQDGLTFGEETYENERTEAEVTETAEPSGEMLEEGEETPEPSGEVIEEGEETAEPPGEVIEEREETAEPTGEVIEEAEETAEPDEDEAEVPGASEETEASPETSSGEASSDASEDNVEGAADDESGEQVEVEETDTESTGERSDSDETAESWIKEIEISLFAGTEYDDEAARELIMAEQAEHFDAAGLILKDMVIDNGFLRSLIFGLKEDGRKNIRVSLTYGGNTQEMEFVLRRDKTEEGGEGYQQYYDGMADNTEPDGGADGYNETLNNDVITVTESETGQQAAGDVQEQNPDDQEIIYEEGVSGEGQTSVEDDEEPASAENDAGIDEEHTPTESDEITEEGKLSEEDDEKIEGDKEPPAIIIRPDDEGSGFKVSADTEEAVSNVYISEAKEIRIIETNAEEIEEAEVVYTVNGETHPMEYGADYEIEKVTTDEGWQYEYVVAPHVFEKDGYYNINITSKDRSGNISNNKTAGTAVSFVVDRTPPAVIVTNLADGEVYKDDGHEYKVTIKDNTLLKYFRIYENKKLKAEYLYDREKWINTQDKTDVLEAPGGTVTLRTEASGETKTMEFEAEDESGNIYRSGSYNIITGKKRSSKMLPFAVTAAMVTLASAIVIKCSGSRKPAARQKSRGRR